MSFTQDWFSQHIPNWTLLLQDLKGQPNLHFLEIGCFEGLATKWLLENILTDETSDITVIDPFDPTPEYAAIMAPQPLGMSGVYERFTENVLDVFPKKVDVHKGLSLDVLQIMDRSGFDFIYIDGSHEAVPVLQDAVLSWERLRKGGIMVFDDYAWFAFPDPTRNPFLGIDAFLSAYRGKYALLHQGYQIFLKKL
jgi:predicted O-methyltransferase YrrM